MSDFSWIFGEPVYMRQVDENSYQIGKLDTDAEVNMFIRRSPEGTVTVDGNPVTNRDDILRYCEMMDNYHEQYGGEMGQIILITPEEPVAFRYRYFLNGNELEVEDVAEGRVTLKFKDDIEPPAYIGRHSRDDGTALPEA